MWQNFSFFLEIIKRLESLAILFFMSIKPSSGGFMKKDPLLLRLVPLSPLVFDDSSCLLAFNNFLELEREGMNFYITKISDKMRGKNIPYPGYNNANMDFLYCMHVEKRYLDFFLEKNADSNENSVDEDGKPDTSSIKVDMSFSVFPTLKSFDGRDESQQSIRRRRGENRVNEIYKCIDCLFGYTLWLP